MPLAQRTGQWVCPNVDGAGAPARATSAPTGPAAQAFRDSSCYPAPPGTGSACWYVVDDFSAYFDMWSYFGSADHIIGQVSYGIDWTVTGSNFRANPVTFSATMYTESVSFEGWNIDACGGQVGSTLSGSYSPYYVGFVPPDVTMSWDPSGYNFYSGDPACKSEVIQVSFGQADSPGVSWPVTMKSPVAYSLDPDTDPLYRFRTAQPSDLPADPLS
ncbi:hypothetical protein [Amycolatopsis sp. NPDC051371]|uniref:hypothetical protein n=1 Tax=Amycolatopsis sp. NPDC051371 TaxID=3155800 RepID=UPI00342B2F08